MVPPPWLGTVGTGEAKGVKVSIGTVRKLRRKAGRAHSLLMCAGVALLGATTAADA
jgi:hypothetical protein